jgi:hypothetical protein
MMRFSRLKRVKQAIGIMTILLLMPLVNALEVPGYASRHTVGLKQIIFTDEDIVVNGIDYIGYAWWDGKIFIDERFISSDYDRIQIMNHELSHLYCYHNGWGFGHNACFRDRNRLLGQIYSVEPWRQDG